MTELLQLLCDAPGWLWPIVALPLLGILDAFSDSSTSTETEITSTEITPTAAGDASIAAGGDVRIPTNTVGEGAVQYKVGKGGKLTINVTSDPDLLQSVLDSQQSNLGSLLSSQQASSAGLSAGLESVLSQLGQLAESKQTDGESGRDRTILYIIVAIAAAVALIFWRRK